MNQIEEHFYETAAQEVATKQVVPGLMAKAFSECDGDERRTIARYIKYRVAQLQEQFASEKAWRTEQEKQRQAQEKKKAEEELAFRFFAPITAPTPERAAARCLSFMIAAINARFSPAGPIVTIAGL